MKKINRGKQVEYLYDNCINNLRDELWTDGVMIKKNTMSKYLKKCYKKSISLENGPNKRLKYCYYLDEINKACLLFTDTCIENINDENEVALKTDAIVVEIYCYEQDFMGEYLWNFYHFSIVTPGKYKSWWENGYYYTDCKIYNDLPLVKAIMRLSDRPEIIRKNTLDDIINGR